MNFVFLMDPLETVVIKKDTTFALMCAASKKGHKVHYLPDGAIVLKNRKVYFHTIPVVPRKNQGDVGIVFIRNDPPFDQQYLLNTWLLDRLPCNFPIINKPSGIRYANEKIWATQFGSLVPKTVISRMKDELLSFLNKEKEVIVKLTNSYGGMSVFYVRKGDLNVNVILETLTQSWKQEIIAQKFIKESRKGDKRILLLDGEILGAVLRVHAKGEHRNNFFSGGKPTPCKITKHDREIIEVLKPKLQELGLYFVGIDIIGDYLIEVNVTSPTCLQEMNYLYDKHLENKVIGFAEKLIAEYRKEKS